MADGWAVKVEMKTMGGGTSTQIWYAHIPDRKAAEEAVKKRIAATNDVNVVALKVISHKEFQGMNVPENDVSQW